MPACRLAATCSWLPLCQHFSPDALTFARPLPQVHKTSFVNLPPNHVYGYEPPKDPENAKQVVNNWKPHVANPHSKPGPDFKAMNKLATMNGLTGAPQQRSFRDTHMILMKEGRPLTPPPLPSDKNPKHVYGQPTSHRTMDECRHLGSFEPKLKNVIQVRAIPENTFAL